MDFSGFIIPKGNCCWVTFIYSLSFFIYYLYEEIFLFFFLKNLQLFLASAEERLLAYKGPIAGFPGPSAGEARVAPPRATAAGAEANDGSPGNRFISLLRGPRWGFIPEPWAAGLGPGPHEGAHPAGPTATPLGRGSRWGAAPFSSLHSAMTCRGRMPCGLHTENPRVSERVLDGMSLSLHRHHHTPRGLGAGRNRSL